MAIIAHCSDTHGKFSNLPQRTEIILHTGDIFADPPYGTKHKDFGKIQMDIIGKQIGEFKNWIGQRPFLFLRGNHDFFSHEWLERFLQDEGIDAHHLHDKIININNVAIYGFPYLPTINGLFATEINEEPMKKKLNDMADIINNLDQIDILGSHCPMYKILDRSSKDENHYGNKLLEDILFNQIDKANRPDYFCFGHVHGSQGITLHRGMVMSNAATRYNMLEIN
jgi:Icc-related predicted phosphoesterase